MQECNATALEKCVNVARLSRRFTKGPESHGPMTLSAGVPKTDTGERSGATRPRWRIRGGTASRR
jgi:CRISPR/Cas system CSM-associated protein Csm4 (group 5 of RAMP superfamily)